jgi:transitional endoplasmic reticulum ATPase
MPLGQVNLDELAEKTHGFVGADLKAVCREASFQALRRVLPGLENTDQTLSHDFLDAVKVEQEDFLTALGEMRPSSGRAFEVDLSGSGWDRIAGYESEIEFLQDLVIWPIKHDRLLSGIGLNTVAGLLITGPSGVGKTLMAKSLAKESGLNVIEITGTELLSKYMGESEKNIREMFKQARQMAPTVLVLDGVDALNSSGWTDSKVLERIANQLAKEMNANSGDRPVVVVATASRSENVPPILRATGRFSHELRLHLPTSSDRLAMFKMWLNAGCLRFPGDYSVLCKESEGLSGGEINDVCQRAFLQKARHVIEHVAEPPDEIPIQSDDVIKVLDRWKLTHRKDHPAS